MFLSALIQRLPVGPGELFFLWASGKMPPKEPRYVDFARRSAPISDLSIHAKSLFFVQEGTEIIRNNIEMLSDESDRLLSADNRYKGPESIFLGIFNPWIWWRQAKRFDEGVHVYDISRTRAKIGEVDLDALRDISIRPINYDRRSSHGWLLTDQKGPVYTKSSYYRSPLEARKDGVKNADQKQPNLNKHPWRVPGFLIGCVLVSGGLLLIGYGAYCFEYLDLKWCGVLLFTLDDIIQFCGGDLMFIIAPRWL